MLYWIYQVLLRRFCSICFVSTIFFCAYIHTVQLVKEKFVPSFLTQRSAHLRTRTVPFRRTPNVLKLLIFGFEQGAHGFLNDRFVNTSLLFHAMCSVHTYIVRLENSLLLTLFLSVATPTGAPDWCRKV